MFELTERYLLSVLWLVLFMTVVMDLYRQRIPNVLVACALVVGLVGHVALDGARGALSSLTGAATGLALFLPLYVKNGMGAGDVKLMAAVGSFVGPLGAFWVALFTLMSGGLIALVLIGWRVAQYPGLPCGAAIPLPPLWRSTFAQMRRERFPFALAIAAGALANSLIRGMWS
jgi:prepilin peptidase CpaA